MTKIPKVWQFDGTGKKFQPPDSFRHLCHKCQESFWDLLSGIPGDRPVCPKCLLGMTEDEIAAWRKEESRSTHGKRGKWEGEPARTRERKVPPKWAILFWRVKAFMRVVAELIPEGGGKQFYPLTNEIVLLQQMLSDLQKEGWKVVKT